MFDLLIVKPIFNLLVFIYALLPGHNFGLALVIFTITVRLLMWPLVKKQLHHAKAMRELQPEVKRVKQASKGNRQQESLMLMALYKEREIKPLASIGILIVQFIILIGLYIGLQRVIDNPEALLANSYEWMKNFGWLKELATDVNKFDMTLLGFIDLTKSAVSQAGIYWPALLLVAGSAVTQYYQSKQLMPTDSEARSLRQILKEASATGKQADQSEIMAANSRNMRYLIPALIFIFTIGLPSALALYWFVGGLVQYLQQTRILSHEQSEVIKTTSSSEPKKIIEGEVISRPHKKKKPSRNKRRKR